MVATIDNPARFEAMRQAMVASQLRTSGVDDTSVIAAMARVPREAFVPAELASVAYRDRPLPLGQGRSVNPPLATALLLNEARIAPGERVLLIGAAGGYAAAVLTAMGAEVTAVEEEGVAAASPDAAIVRGPLAAGAPDRGPFDVIVVDGAVERLPDALVEQARPGGRIVTGLVDRGVTRLASGERTEGGFGLFDFADIECVVLPGFETPRGFTF